MVGLLLHRILEAGTKNVVLAGSRTLPCRVVLVGKKKRVFKQLPKGWNSSHLWIFMFGCCWRIPRTDFKWI